MVVDATVGLTKDDFELAKYVKETYVSRGQGIDNPAGLSPTQCYVLSIAAGFSGAAVLTHRTLSHSVGGPGFDLAPASCVRSPARFEEPGLRVVLAVAKADRLETMDLKAADFWELGLGEPLPLSAYHRRGVWEMMDALVNRGCALAEVAADGLD